MEDFSSCVSVKLSVVIPYSWHYLVNRFLTFLSNLLTDLNLTDMEPCYKVFRLLGLGDNRSNHPQTTKISLKGKSEFEEEASVLVKLLLKLALKT